MGFREGEAEGEWSGTGGGVWGRGLGWRSRSSSCVVAAGDQASSSSVPVQLQSSGGRMRKVKGRQKGGRLRSSSSLQLSIRLFICVFAVLQIQQPRMVAQGEETAAAADDGDKKPVDIDKVKEYIVANENQDMSKFTYDQLEKWFLNKSDEYKLKPWDYPRAFPFCVTRAQIIQGHKGIAGGQPKENEDKPIRVPEDSRLFKFERYFHGVEHRRKKFYQFDPLLDSTVHNHTFVKNISFTRINTPEPDMINLRQWVHVKVEMAEPMQGLYLQTVAGPFGLPFGEFTVEFPCADSMDTTKDIADVGELSYCSYRPQNNIYHPSVYVGVTQDKTKPKPPDTTVKLIGRKVFHVHFRWFDMSCLETPYLQFLMLVVKNFTTNPEYGIDYVAQTSPVFLNTDLDSQDGSPYPYYPGYHNRTFCFVKSQPELVKAYTDHGLGKFVQSGKNGVGMEGLFAPIKWKPSAEVIRIQPNEEYDDCILYDKAIHVDKTSSRNEDTYECGPGPFRCDKSYESKSEQLNALRESLVMNETILSKCSPCGVPECTRIGFLPEYCNLELPPVNDLEGETNVLTNLDDNTRIRGHGVAGMLAFLFFIPIGQFIGRFYKDVLGKCLFGNGPWIFAHITCGLLAIMSVWVCMGPMVPTLSDVRARRTTCLKIYNTSKHRDFADCLEGYHIVTPHTVSGLIAFILIHLVPLFGFARPSSAKLRFLMSAIHSHLGYLTYFVGVVSVFLALEKPRCFDTLVFCIFLVLLPIVFSVVVFFMDLMMDKRLGVRPSRRQWPVLEELQLDKRGPLEIPKLFVLAAFITLMVIIWFLALVSLHFVEGSGEKLLEGTNDFKGKKGKYLGKLQGLFGDCGSSENK